MEVDCSTSAGHNASMDCNTRVGFVGAGNMAQALLGGFLKSGLIKSENVIASAPSDRNLKTLLPLGIKTTNDNNLVVKESDVIFLCVKPHLIHGVINSFEVLDPKHNPLFISIISGISTPKLEVLLTRITSEPRLIRTMPNTPCLVSQGCVVFCLGRYADEKDGVLIRELMGSVGLCHMVPESQIDAVCGLAGSGPAYIYAAIEALADGGVKMGIPRSLAQELAAQMVKGAATMVIETGKHPGQLKDEVCSPAGTTITAMHSLEKNGFRNALISAVEASATRSKELGGN